MALLLPWLLLACGSAPDPDDAASPAPTAPSPSGSTSPILPTLTPATTTPAEEVDRYDATRLTEVAVTLDEADWRALGFETRLFVDVLLGPECFTEPPSEVFSWYPADVVIDGEPLGEVGVRKKGFLGSMSWSRPSLKVDSDRFVPDQRFADDTEHFTFNNNNQDPSRLHTCLAYEVFTAAGVPAPRCSLATVTVNGEPLGIYTNVEPIKRPFLRRVFGTDEGALYEGTVSDVLDGMLGTFDIKTDGEDLAPLIELTELLDTVDDDELLMALDEVLDLDGFVTMWAAESLIGHWDGYASGRNNYYVYHHPDDGRLRFVPWGADAVFEWAELEPLFTNGRLADRLYDHPDGRQRYLDELQRLLDEVWNEAELHARIDALEGLTASERLDDATSSAAVDTIRAFVDDRRAVVEALLEAPPDPFPWSGAPPECVDSIGTVQATFDTEWDSLALDMTAYEATLTGDTFGTPFLSDVTGSGAGSDTEFGSLLVVWGTGGNFVQFDQVIVYFPDDLQPGTYPIDPATLFGLMIQTDFQGDTLHLVGGSITFDHLETVPGGRVSGHLEGTVIPDIFGLQ